VAQFCILVMRPPSSNEEAERMCSLVNKAKEKGLSTSMYMLGDGVYCVKRRQERHLGYNIRAAIDSGSEVLANAKDLQARGIQLEQVEPGVKVIDDLEGAFVEDVMENSTRAISW